MATNALDAAGLSLGTLNELNRGRRVLLRQGGARPNRSVTYLVEIDLRGGASRFPWRRTKDR
jgi:hypothetical protein